MCERWCRLWSAALSCSDGAFVDLQILKYLRAMTFSRDLGEHNFLESLHHYMQSCFVMVQILIQLLLT